MRPIVIIGTGGHAREVAEIVQAQPDQRPAAGAGRAAD